MDANTVNVVEANASLYSDLYKDLNGFRPDLARFRALTLDEQQEDIEHISATLADEIAEEAHAAEFEDDSRYDEPYGLIGGDSDLWDEW